MQDNKSSYFFNRKEEKERSAEEKICRDRGQGESRWMHDSYSESVSGDMNQVAITYNIHFRIFIFLNVKKKKVLSLDTGYLV